MLYKADKKELKQKIKKNTLNISQSTNKSFILNIDFLRMKLETGAIIANP